jgi:hypothetical protein
MKDELEALSSVAGVDGNLDMPDIIIISIVAHIHLHRTLMLGW